MRSVTVRGAFLAMTAAAPVACGGDKGGGPAPTIQVSVSPSALTVPQGSSGTVTLTLVRGGGFDRAVTAAVSGLPTGVTASVNPSSLSGSTTTGVVTVDVASSVAVGTYTATITASATGVGSATTTYQLTVTAPPNYSLSANPASQTVQSGTSGAPVSVNIARTNFTGAIALTLDNPPAGITGAFNPASATADNSALTVSVAATVTAGSYTLTIKGSAAGPGDKTTTLALTVTAAANYSLAVTPSPVAIVQGQSSDLMVTITRTNFSGAVSLSLSSPPAGVTGMFNPASATGNSSTLTLAVGSAVAAGNYTITVMGTAAGVPTVVDGASASGASAAPGDRLATFQLTVNLAAAIALSMNPASISVPQGGSGTSAATIARTNHSAAVNLVASGMPNGLGVTMNPASTTGNTSTAMVNVGASVSAGTYQITVTATSTGVAAATSMFNVQVTPLASSTVEYAFCDTPAAFVGANTVTTLPAWFAFRNGTGPWTEVMPTTVGTLRKYTFMVNQPTIEVAWAILDLAGVLDQMSAIDEHLRFDRMMRRQPDAGPARALALAGPTRVAAARRGAGADVWTTYHSQLLRSEGPPPSQTSCPVPVADVAVNVNFQNLVGPEVARVYLKSAGAFVVPPTTLGIVNVPPGLYDAWALFGTSQQITHADVQRNVNITAGSTLTFNRTTSLPVVGSTVGLFNVPAGMMVSDFMLFGSTNGVAGPVPLGPPSTSTTRTLIRHQTVATGDYWRYSLTGTQTTGQDTEILSNDYFLSAFPPSIALGLPQPVAPFTVTQLGTSPPRYRTSGSLHGSFDEDPVTAVFIGSPAVLAAGNSYIMSSTADYRLTTGGNSLPYSMSMEAFAGANYPSAAFLTAPLVTAIVTVGSVVGPISASRVSFSSRSRVNP